MIKVIYLFLLLFVFLYPIPYTLYPSFAAGVDIGDKFGFGEFQSLGQLTQQLVNPAFSIAAFLVVLYFLLGAFKYLRAGGNKEEVEGGRQMITHAIVGFILLMFAFFILQFIPEFFGLNRIDIIR